MTQKEKELLLKDLCGRLLYGVKAYIEHDTFYDEIEPYDGMVDTNTINDLLRNEKLEVRPYLRSMSSMTEKEKKEIKALGAEFSSIGSIRFRIKEDENDGFEYGYKWIDILDFLITHHFDYRGLIPMRLALEAPEDMYKIEYYE